jgi:hypothetical protein
MKLRLKGNSLRLRLTRSEVVRLRDEGAVEESAEFGGGAVLRYRINARKGTGSIETAFQDGVVEVLLPQRIAHEWACSDEVGIYGASGAMQVAIEKDFRCLTRPEEQEDPDVYPNPNAAR